MKNGIFRKRLVFGIVLILVTSLIVVFQIENVKASGNTLYVGGSGEGNYTSIQSAIYEANPGDTIYVYSGTYYENVQVYKSINLVGEDRDTTIIDGDLPPHLIGTRIVVAVLRDGVSIEGFTVRNGSLQGIFIRKNPSNNSNHSNNSIRDCISYNNGIGIYIGAQASISNCNIYSNSEEGIVAIGCLNKINYCNIHSNNRGITISGRFNIISDCDIYNNTYEGIAMGNSSTYNLSIYNSTGDNQISDCNIYSNNGEGIVAIGCLNKINYCNIHSNNRGITISGRFNIISDCDIYNNTYEGIAMGNSSIYNLTGDNQISDCNIYSNNNYGIELIRSWANTISNCYIADNDYGIQLCYSSGNEFTACDITDNVIGVYSTTIPTANTFIGNNITNNSLYGIYNDELIELVAEYNWWGNISGPHHLINNQNGTGDNVSDYVDFYPWVGAAIMDVHKEDLPSNESVIVDAIEEADTTIAINSSETSEITLIKYVDNPEGNMTEGVKAVGKYIDVIVTNESNINYPVNITIYYTQNDLDNINATEEDITGMDYWNETALEWQLYNDTGVNKSFSQGDYVGYVWALAWNPIQLCCKTIAVVFPQLEFDLSSDSIIAINTNATLRILVTANGDPRQGEIVAFSSTPANLTFTPTLAVTNTDGYAAVTATSDTAAIYTVTAIIRGDISKTWTLVVYDPSGGFVTGGGWINSPEGAYTPDPSVTGKANFGFVSKYKKGQSPPSGNTEFNFKIANMNFHSDDYDWLVIARAKAIYKGTGTINGEGNYGFILSAIDEELTPSTNVDLFRIKIWDKDNNDEVIYDNQLGDEDDSDPATAIGCGQIKIHKE